MNCEKADVQKEAVDTVIKQAELMAQLEFEFQY